jgi:hypothetical protein
MRKWRISPLGEVHVVVQPVEEGTAPEPGFTLEGDLEKVLESLKNYTKLNKAWESITIKNIDAPPSDSV